MTIEYKGRISSQFARLSTGVKMLLILSLGLLPLGLMAVLASVQSTTENRLDQSDEVKAQLAISAQRLNGAFSRSVITIRAASAAIASVPPGSNVCRATLERLLVARGLKASYALYGTGGRLRCTSPGFSAPAQLVTPGAPLAQATIAPDGRALRFAVFDEQGNAEGIGEYAQDALAALGSAPRIKRPFDLALVQGSRTMILRHGYTHRPLAHTLSFAQPVADGTIRLQITSGAMPITAAGLLMIVLPLMMWAAAAFIGWLIVDRLLLRPLVRMQAVISAYRPGDRGVDLPSVSTPAREIGELGEAFNQVTQTVARHEADLEAAVDRQKRLVREVHHRVKNNLQVVASLLNLHSRGSRNEDVAAAYASIQRRVDALAVVHRNHYAELEQNRGVALKPLISELAANLRATAPASAAKMSISLDVEAFYVTQDTAVSVAFLITELVEFAMFCAAPSVHISVLQDGGGNAMLAVESASLRDINECDPALLERFERIVTGLSRQLRSSLDRDREAGRYALAITVLERAI